MAALSEIEKLEARYAENPDGRYFAPLADAYRKAGRVDEAITVVTSGLNQHPDYLSAHIVLDGHPSLEEAQVVGAAVKAAVGARFGIAHATIELECETCSPVGDWCSIEEHDVLVRSVPPGETQ